MKSNTGIILAMAAIGSAAFIRPRADPPAWPNVAKGFDMLGKVIPNVRPNRVIEASPRLRPNSIRKQVRFGPYNLPAAKEDASAGHSHGSNGPLPSSFREMTLSQAIASVGGQVNGMGIPQITVGQILQSWGYIWNGEYEAAMKLMINTTLDPNGMNVVSMYKADAICTDCTILAAKADLVYENGTRADISTGVYLHHLNNLNLGDKPVAAWLNLCPTSQTTLFGVDLTSFIGDTVVGPLQPLSMGSVDEYMQWYTTPDGAFPSGHYVDPSDRLFLQAEAINYLRIPQKVYIQVDAEYVKGKAGKHATITPISVTGCTPAIGFTGRGKAGNVTSEEFAVRVDGTVVSARGHLHDGGTNIVILLNDRPVCTSHAIYGTKLKNGEGGDWTTISQMTDCEESFKVKKGDQIKLVVNYDEVAHPVRQSAGMEQEEMGFMWFTFVPN